MDKTFIDDMDVFDSMRALLSDGVDLDDRAAVERAIPNSSRYKKYPELTTRFVNWVIKAAKANAAAGGLERHRFGEAGFVPPEDDPEEPEAA